jgi:hypothetical protein
LLLPDHLDILYGKDVVLMSGQLRQRAVLRGLGWGLVASLLASWTFTLLAFLKVFYLDPFFDFQLPPPTPSELFADFGVVLVFLFFGFSFSMLSSCIPGMIGGAVLGVLVHYTAPRVARPVRVSTLMGIVVGVMAGVISSCPGLVMFPRTEQGIDLLLVMAYMTAALAGGLVGWRLGLAYQSGSQSTESGPS